MENPVCLSVLLMWSKQDRELQSDVGCYYAVETNYRLLLFSKLFQNYRRMLYLDCDIIVTGDVGELFDVDLEGKSAAGVEDVGFRWLAYTKRAIFLDNKPYNVLNYCTDVLGMKDPGGYVNAGVLLFDLEKCRQKVSFRDVVETLHSRNFFYNDQDVLNILLEGNIKQVDCKWNYMNNIAFYLECDRKEFRELYLDLYREDYRIIHYISAKKPWNGEVPMGEVWQKYADE